LPNQRWCWRSSAQGGAEMKLPISISTLNDALLALDCKPQSNKSHKGWIAACPVEGCKGDLTYRSSAHCVEYQCSGNSCRPEEICERLEIECAVPTTAAVIETVALEPRQQTEPKSVEFTKPTEEKPSSAARLISMVQEIFCLGQNHKQEPFAVRRNGPNIALWLSGNGGSLRNKIAFEYRKRYKGVMNATAFTDALATLLGEAMNTEPQKVWIRVGPYANGIVLDLGTLDGSAVVVDATGWRIVERSPILFQRTALTGALPKPIKGGSLNSLRELLNVSSTTWPILLGYMVTALMPEIPHPILMLGGGQGTGKSTAAKFICKLLDPSDAIFKTQPRDPESWATTASNSWTILIDNVSSIPAWMSDSLCKAVTGDGFIKRALYTNNEPLVLSFLRVIMLTSIDAGALRGDLGERLVLVDLEPIHETNRKTDKELNRMYDAAQPAILGALLDLLVQVMSKLETVKVPRLPRMADFAKVLAAMDEATGMGSLAIYETQGNRIAGEVIESDPYGSAIVRFMSTRKDWSGTAQELLDAIMPAEGGREWRINGRKLSAQLKRLAPALLVEGVQVIPPRPTDRPRVYVLLSTDGTVGSTQSTDCDFKTHLTTPSVQSAIVEPTSDRRNEKPQKWIQDEGLSPSDGSDGLLHPTDLDNLWSPSN